MQSYKATVTKKYDQYKIYANVHCLCTLKKAKTLHLGFTVSTWRLWKVLQCSKR